MVHISTLKVLVLNPFVANLFLNGFMHIVVLIMSYVNMFGFSFHIFFLKIIFECAATIVAGGQICCMHPFNVKFE